jgi:hypothetical protein
MYVEDATGARIFGGQRCRLETRKARDSEAFVVVLVPIAYVSRIDVQYKYNSWRESINLIAPSVFSGWAVSPSPVTRVSSTVLRTL